LTHRRQYDGASAPATTESREDDAAIRLLIRPIRSCWAVNQSLVRAGTCSSPIGLGDSTTANIDYKLFSRCYGKNSATISTTATSARATKRSEYAVIIAASSSPTPNFDLDRLYAFRNIPRLQRAGVIKSCNSSAASARRTCRPLRANWASQTCVALRPLRAGQAHWSLRTCRSGRSWGSLQSDGTKRNRENCGHLIGEGNLKEIRPRCKA